MTKRTPAEAADPTPAFEAALVLYGLDEGGKPHAAAFAAEEVELATRAASLMQLVTLPVASDECRRLAPTLPRGKIFSSGKAFAPFIKRDLYGSLKALGGQVPPAPEPPPADPFDAMVAAARPAASWESLAVGQLVLAGEEPALGGGHWAAIITELRPEHLVVLKWRDWSDLPAFPRRIADLGLLHADAVSEPATDGAEPGGSGDTADASLGAAGEADQEPAEAAG